MLEQLYSIVNARYEEERSMILTTNIIEQEELGEQIGERTVSRLQEICEPIPLRGEDCSRHVPAVPQRRARELAPTLCDRCRAS